ncbi:MAG: glycosyltransferase [Clostridiales bacterium]|nr:glycosyltransferase [Clostridiales bacterium]
MPKLSVVVPVCNAQKYLRECLDSILGQTLRDIEVICVDDGSKDESGAMLDGYAARDARVRVIHKVNTGYGHSMNCGFDAAEGEYLGIVESDDWIEPDMFEKLCRAADMTKADAVKSNFYLYYGEPAPRDEFFGVVPARLCGKVFKPLESVDLEKIDFWNGKPSIWSAIYRRDFIRGNNIRFNETPGASYQDASFNFKVWACAERVFCLDRAFLHYRQDNAGSSVNASTSKVYCVRDEYDEMERFIAGRGADAALLERIMNRLRFDSYMWNTDRLMSPMKEEFAAYAAETFRTLLAQGRLDQAMFAPERWRFMQRFIKTGKTGAEKSAPRIRRDMRAARDRLRKFVRSWTRFYPEGGEEGR